MRPLVVGRPDGPLRTVAKQLADRPEYEATFVDAAEAVPTDLGEVDCVVSANSLPDGTGLNLLETIRTREKLLPFVLFADDGNEALASRAISAGVTEYIRAEEVDELPKYVADRISELIAEYFAQQEIKRGYTALETAQEGISLLNEDGEFTYVNEEYANIYGYDPEELVGEHWEILYPEGEAGEVEENILPIVDEEGHWTGNTTGRRSDGSTFPEQHSLAKAGDGLACVVRDVSERKRRERRLATLNTLTRSLMKAEETETIVDRVIDAADEQLAFPHMAIALYDHETGDLTVHSQTDTEFPASTFCSVDGPGWEAFINSSRRVTQPGHVYPEAEEVAAVALGKHGVLLLAEPDGFGDAELEFIETLASNVEAALDRADREQMLHEREQRLEEQNEALERLNDINDIIRRIDQGLVSASSREEIERVVCRHLADRGPYELAWIGRHDPISDEIVPRASGGNENGYLDEIRVTGKEEQTAEGPVGRAFSQLEPQTIDDILEDPSFEPWRSAALNRGYRSCTALPLEYEGSIYGILTVYAGAPHAFSDLEKSVLSELSQTIAHAINAIESKKGLLTDEVVELEFEFDDADAVRGARSAGIDFTLEGIVPRSDGNFRAFLATRGADPETVRDALIGDEVRSLTRIGEQDADEGNEFLFEAILTEESVSGTVLDHGGVVQNLTVTDGHGIVQLEVPASRDVREFIAMFRRTFPDAKLRGRREHERTAESKGEFRARIEEELTARQREVLQTAYFSGYFESPRDRTASEIAESLDIAQPTFTTHIRTALRKVLTMLLEENKRHLGQE